MILANKASRCGLSPMAMARSYSSCMSTMCVHAHTSAHAPAFHASFDTAILRSCTG
jgi:hypothetical protein